MTREDINDIINAICPNDEDYEKPCISPKYLRQELEQLVLDQKQWNGEPTTKNNLGVDKTFYEQIMEYCKEHFLVLVEKDVWDDAEKALTTKNNLAVDCIDRAKAHTKIEMNASRYTIAKEREGMGQVEWSDQLIKVSDAVNIIRELPSVTPKIEPKKGHWIEEFNDIEGEVRFTCSSCGKYQLFGTDFCYNCGSDNREVENE